MKVRNLQELQDIFNIRYGKIKNKILLIEDELKQIDEFFKTEGKNIYRPDIVDFLSNNDIAPNSVFNTHWIYPPTGYFPYFKYYYEGYLYEEIEHQFPERKATDKFTQNEMASYLEGVKPVRLQAIELAKYTIWLKELKINPSVKVPISKSDLSLKQRILALHYLGLDFNKYNQTALGDVLSLVIDKNDSNTRTAINELLSAKNENKIKSNENLLKMLEIFDNKAYTNIKLKINNDLEKFGVPD
tara:strand:+ start:360 stop:1091 length:732 start_codon:yes stop_codon:yes gene_type:complete